MFIWLKIALRNVFRQKRRSLLTGLTIMGCYLLLSFSLSIGEGSYANIIQMMTSSRTGHIQVHEKTYLDTPSLYKLVTQPQRLMAALGDLPEIASMSPRIHGAALAFFEERAQAVRLMGIDPRLEAQTIAIKKRLDQGRYLEKKGEILLGSSAAKILRAKVGDEVFLISQGRDGSIANDGFKVVGMIGRDKTDPDAHTVFMGLEDAQAFLSLYDGVHEIVIRLQDGEDPVDFAASLNQQMKRPELLASSWQEVEKEFFRSMTLDKQGNDYLLVIIMMIVGLGVVNSVLMATLERQREFGLMKAMGTRPLAVFGVIFAEVFLLSLLFLGLALPLCWGLNLYMVYEGIDLGIEVEIAGQVMGRMRGEISWYTLGYPGIVVFATALGVTLWPAWRAAAIDPVQALRKH